MRYKEIQWLLGPRIDKWGATFLSWIQHRFLSAHKDRGLLECIRRTRSDRHMLHLTSEAFLVYTVARAQVTLPGHFAEVGVFQGATARLICEAKEHQRLDLFDTFTGLPRSTSEDDPTLVQSKYTCSRRSVETYLSSYENLVFCEGRFPDSAMGQPKFEDSMYSFVHLDVDLYESTKASLEFFYPRLSPGGIILIARLLHPVRSQASL